MTGRVTASSEAASLLALLDAPDWHQQAACLKTSKTIFFSYIPADIERANGYCANCPVRRDCALFGVEQPEGRWAGFTAFALRRMRTKRSATWNQLVDEVGR